MWACEVRPVAWPRGWGSDEEWECSVSCVFSSLLVSCAIEEGLTTRIEILFQTHVARSVGLHVVSFR